MAFFFADAKKAAPKNSPGKGPKRPQDLPIHLLQGMGCQACPRRALWSELKSPKIQPSGAANPLVYVLVAGPSNEDDRRGEFMQSPGMSALLAKFPRALLRKARFGGLTQCAPDREAEGRDVEVSTPEMECCRGRVSQDIEEARPLLILGVGDRALQWATGLPAGTTTLTHRGSLFPVKIGTHECWFMPVVFPNWAAKKRAYGINEYELATEHDLAAAERLVCRGDLPVPKMVPKTKRLEGIELITGQKPGDFGRLERWLADMSTWPQVGFDIETNGLRPYHLRTPKILTAAIGTREQTVAFAVDHPLGWGAASREDKVRHLLGEFLLYSNLKLAHNLAMEMEWANYFYGPQVLLASDWGDTMAMCHTLDERPGTKSLEVQTLLGFGFDLKAESSIDLREKEWWLRHPLDKILLYNGGDAKWTEARARQLAVKINDDDAMRREYQRKVALAPALVLTEAQGLPVSIPRAEKIDDALVIKVEALGKSIAQCPEVRTFGKMFGPFNPGNSDHVLQLLRDVCKRPEVSRKDRDGAVSQSADEDVLTSLPADEVPSAPLILEHRGVQKLRSTYIAPVISGKIISVDGLVHSKYSSMVAETGRLNCEDPNAQNWPKRKHREVRGIFYAEDDQEVCAIDYGQIEFRVVGMASEDKNLVRACWTGYDVHTFWAERMVALYPSIKDRIVRDFGVDWDQKGLKTLRQEAKNMWVFPQLFGASLRSCAAQLQLPEDVAEELGAEFWDEFAGVKRWQDGLLKNYEKRLYVETLGGRRRRGPMTKNQIINHPIQGTACDIVTEAHVALCHLAYIEDQWEYQPRLNVHDDLSTWLAKKTRDERVAVMVREMCRHRFPYINVPLVVEVSVGPDWANLTEIAKYRSDELFNIRNPYK